MTLDIKCKDYKLKLYKYKPFLRIYFEEMTQEN